jgi:putative transposase
LCQQRRCRKFRFAQDTSIPPFHFCSFEVDLPVAIFVWKPILTEVRNSREGKDIHKVPIRTLRFKVRPEVYAWLNAAAIETNQVWNYFNATSFRAARPFAAKPRYLSGFDLCNLSAGASKYFGHIGAHTIQRIATEYANKRSQFKKARLRWRVSSGSRRSLGWIPFKAASIRRHHRYLRFCGKVVRIFESERFAGIVKWQSGCFAQDAVGDWYLCLPVAIPDQSPAPQLSAVGIDLGLKDTAVTSDGERLPAGRFYRSPEAKIAQAQRRGHKRQAKRLHRRASRRRHNALHQFSRRVVNQYQNIFIGDVSSLKLVKTRMAKSVLDSGWGILKTQLLYKGEYAGRSVRIVNERNTSRTCSLCDSLSGPTGVNGLRVRSWICSGCGAIHDRDVNSARNMLTAERLPPSVYGNETSQRHAPPSRAPRPRKARKARGAAAS